ncbi:MAG: DUF998 domain-containing protein [Thermoplasmatota archaeon]|nr:DUF998 domain-containing protein [Candidatus Thermoplasmatota archaeon]MBU1914157.1 DUF998 domain-containing protein [Candidatus Thermoplasmatota archaeon]
MVNLRSPGFWLLIGGLEMLFMVHLAEFLYPGYSTSQNYISDLGVGPTSSRLIFTGAIIIFGLMALVTAALLRLRPRKSLIWLFLALSGIGAIGVGVFNEDYIPEVHALFAFLAFLFGNLAVIYSSKMVRPPMSYLFILLGLIGLSALALFAGNTYAGLGAGGMERMIFYPAMFWAIGFGAYLLAEENRVSRVHA